MAIAGGPDVVQDGLVFSLDAADRNSYAGSGNVWNNLTVTAPLSASLVNGATYLTTNQGSLSFATASLQSATGSDLGSLNRFTVDCWFNLASLPTTVGAAAVVTNAFPGSTAQLNFSIGLNNSPTTANICFGFFDTNWRNTSGFAPVINTWYNVTGTYDGATIIQYLNGASQSTLSYVGTPTSSTSGIRIARRWDVGTGGNVDYINGQIPVVRIYNRALTATEVAQNYSATKTRFGL